MNESHYRMDPSDFSTDPLLSSIYMIVHDIQYDTALNLNKQIRFLQCYRASLYTSKNPKATTSPSELATKYDLSYSEMQKYEILISRKWAYQQIRDMGLNGELKMGHIGALNRLQYNAKFGRPLYRSVELDKTDLFTLAEFFVLSELGKYIDIELIVDKARKIIDEALIALGVDVSTIGSINLSRSYNPSASIQFTISVPEHYSEKQALRYVRELVLNADECHRNLGGNGLKIDDLRVMIPQLKAVTE